MAQIPAISTLRVEDFPSERTWIGRFLLPVNQFFTSVAQAINGNLIFGANLTGVSQVLTFVANGSDLPKRLGYGLSAKAIEHRLVHAYKDGTPIAMIHSWYQDNSEIVITNLVEFASSGATSTLSVGSRYELLFRAQP